jgi:tRNA threonylcarbamoyladenosine biosynthesis protein TsaB
MNVLAIDTATDLLAVAVRTDSGFFESIVDSSLKHSEMLLSLVDALVGEAGLVPADIELIALSCGPGSFTGLRIGYATARGISLAVGCPIVAVPTLDAIAHARTLPCGAVIPTVDAKKNRFYAAIYRGDSKASAFLDSPAGEIAALAREDESVLVTGPAAALFLEKMGTPTGTVRFMLDPDYRSPPCRALIELAMAGLRDGTVLSEDSGPIYLRKSEAEIAFSGE